MKKRITSINEREIVQSLMKKDTFRQEDQRLFDLESKNKKLYVQNQELKKDIKKFQQVISKCKQKIISLNQEVKQIKYQKQKSMELNILEKLSIEQKNNLLTKQIQSKKTIIESLSKQLDKSHFYQADLRNKERKLFQKSKQLQNFERQFSDHFKSNQNRYIERIKGLETQNNFLKKKVKQILKKLKKGCKCQGQTAQWKNQVYELGRQLVKARIQLGKAMFIQERAQKKRQNQKQNKQNSDSQLESLSLSDNSQEDLPNKTPKNYSKYQKRK